jgi:hypothetical protein
MRRRSMLLATAMLALRDIFPARAMAEGQCFRAGCRPGPDMDLTACDFSGQDLEGMSFQESKLWGAKFAGANLVNANFEGADLDHACLTDADLRGANLDFARTLDTIFCYTRMTDGLILMSGCGSTTECCPRPIVDNPRGGE